MNQIFFSGYDAIHPENFYFEAEQGYFCCLLVLTASPARFLTDGQMRSYPAGQIIFYPPHRTIRYSADGAAYQNDWVRFGTNDPAFLTFPKPAIPFPAADPGYYHSLIQLLTWEASAAPEGRAIDHLLAVLAQKMYQDIHFSRHPPKEQELTALRKEMQNNPQHPWTVSEMAARLHISAGYLQALYKRQFGVSCMDDVLRARIRCAEELLSSTDQSVESIAYTCGYQNVEHFCRQFRDRAGRSPLQYRKEARMRGEAEFHNVAGKGFCR